MYVGNINNKMYEMYGNGAIQDWNNKTDEMRENKLMTTLKVAGIDPSKQSKFETVFETVSEDSLILSKAAQDIKKFCQEFGESEIVQDIRATLSEQDKIKQKYEIQKWYEEQGIECPDSTEYNYDKTKHAFYSELNDDLMKMVGGAVEYYKKNGSFIGMTSEDISKETTAIEYKDLGILVDLKEEMGRIDKDDFITTDKYYEALLEKIDKSDLSDKAKKSIGGYIKHLQRESKKIPELHKKKELSPEEIEKELARIREAMERENEEAAKRKEIHQKEVLKLNKELTKMYMKNYIR